VKTLGKWWRGAKCNCAHCGETVEFEDSDEINVENEYIDQYSFTCPVCYKRTFFLYKNLRLPVFNEE
jgi:hypothetical protein